MSIIEWKNQIEKQIADNFKAFSDLKERIERCETKIMECFTAITNLSATAKERIEKLESVLQPRIHSAEEGIPDQRIMQSIGHLEQRISEIETPLKEDKPTNSNKEFIYGHFAEKPKDSRCQHWNSNWDACEILDEHKRDIEIELLKDANQTYRNVERFHLDIIERALKLMKHDQEEFSFVECATVRKWIEILEGKS